MFLDMSACVSVLDGYEDERRTEGYRIGRISLAAATRHHTSVHKLTRSERITALIKQEVRRKQKKIP